MEKSDKVEIKYPVFKMTRMCCCGKSSDGPINLQVTHNLVLNLKLIRERLKEIHHSVFCLHLVAFTGRTIYPCYYILYSRYSAD